MGIGIGFFARAGLGAAFGSLPVALALAYLPIGIRTVCQIRQKKHDNLTPRAAELPTGLATRADGCHKNQLEMFPIFSSGVGCAAIAGVPSALISKLAKQYIIGRIIYSVVYLVGEEKTGTHGNVRSAVWALGCFIPVLRLFMEASAAAN